MASGVLIQGWIDLPLRVIADFHSSSKQAATLGGASEATHAATISLGVMEAQASPEPPCTTFLTPPWPSCELWREFPASHTKGRVY